MKNCKTKNAKKIKFQFEHSMESDPEVRDACYAALGSAMRVIGEKAMGTLITDIAEDKLKMAKVQTFFNF